MSFCGLLNNTFNLIALGMTADAYGGWSTNASTVSGMSALPCRFYELSAREREILNREGTDATHKLYCDYSATITTQHEVEVSSLRYQIVRVNNPSMANRHLELTTNRIA